MPIKYFISVLIALLTISLSHAENINPEKLHERVSERALTAGINGLAYAIIIDGQIQYTKTLGNSDIDGRTPIHTSTLFRIGELSKLSTSLMLLRLLEQQQLSSNTEAANSAGIENPFGTTHPLKLTHLLDQTSGLPSTSYKNYKSYRTDINPSQVSQLDSSAQTILRPPGEHYLDSHLDFTVAAAIAEKKTSTPFDDLMNDLIFAPLGMAHSSYTNVSTPSLSDSFKTDGSLAPYWQMNLRPSLAMRASIEDMALLTQYIAAPDNAAALLSPQQFEQLFQSDAIAAKAGFELHPGKGLAPYMSSGHLFWGGTGQIDGFYASLGVQPQTGNGFVLLANTHEAQALRLIREDLSHYVSQGVSLPALPPEAIVNHQQHEGWWVPVGQKSELSRWLWDIAGHVYLAASPKGLQINQVMPGIDLRQLVAIDTDKYRPLRSDKAILQFFEYRGEQFLISSTLEVYRQLTLGAVLPYLLLGLVALYAFGGGLLVGIFCLPLALIRVISHKYTIASQALLGLSSACCIASVVIFLQHDLSDDFALSFHLGSINATTLWLAALSIMWPLLLATNVWLLWSYGYQFGRGTYYLASSTSLGQLILLVYLASHHWVPLFTWQY